MTQLKKLTDFVLQRMPREPFPGSPLLLQANKILPNDELNRLDNLQLTSKQKDDLKRYVAVTAYEIVCHETGYAQNLSKGDREKYVVATAQTLLVNLIKNDGNSLDLVVKKTIEQLFGKKQGIDKKIIDTISEIKKEENPNVDLKNDPKREYSIVSDVINAAKKQMSGGDGGSVIRAMMGVYNEAIAQCKKEKVLPHLKNLTLGDVTGKNMPTSVVETLGYNPLGQKGLAISARAQAYEAILYDAGVDFDPHRYDLASLGWEGLRKRFIEYGAQFGLLDPNEVCGSMIGEGGAGTLYRVFTAAQMYFQKESSGHTFSAYFPNPAFRMVGDAAHDAGFSVIETSTKPSDGFFPDIKEVDLYFSKHSECKIYIFIPIGNPNANFPIMEKVEALLHVLKKYNILLVNDFAYLGTGNREQNKELAHALSAYKKRIDSFSMSKIFGRTGLRCGCALTMDPAIAAQFSPAAKHIQLGLSYPTQQVAMALWEYVTQSDRNILNEYYRTQQKNLLQTIKGIDKKRIVEGKKPLLSSKNPIFDRAGLYLYIPLTEGFDAFDVLKETGYVGVPDSAFSNSSLKIEGSYMRFALGVEKI